MRTTSALYQHLRATLDETTGGTHRNELQAMATAGRAGLTLTHEAPDIARLAADLADLDPHDLRRLRATTLDAVAGKDRNERVRTAAAFDALLALAHEAAGDQDTPDPATYRTQPWPPAATL